MGFSSVVLRWALTFERWRAGFRPRSVHVEGQPVAYLDTGKGQSVVLLLHGFAGDKDNWSRFVSHMPATYRYLAVDLPGFGDSPLPLPEMTVLSEQVERLVHFLQALNIKRVHLVGNSMGAHLAFLFAVRFPDRVASLSAFDPTGIQEGRTAEQFRLYEESGFNSLLVSSVADYERLLDFIFVHRPFLPCPVRRAMAEVAIGKSPFFEAAWATIFYDRYEPLEPFLSSVACPVLLGWGDGDRVVDRRALVSLQRQWPTAPSYVFEDCGHLPAVEQPERAARRVRDFLELAAQR